MGEGVCHAVTACARHSSSGVVLCARFGNRRGVLAPSPPTPEAVKKFPLSQRGRRRSDSGRVAARGLCCEFGKALPQHVVSRWGAPPSLGLPTWPDNPRAFGAAPFSKGEFLSIAGPSHFFHSSPLPRWGEGSQTVEAHARIAQARPREFRDRNQPSGRLLQPGFGCGQSDPLGRG